MSFKGGRRKIRSGLRVVVVLIALLVLIPGPRNAALAGGGDTAVAVAAPIAGVLGVAAIAYGVWINRPGAPERPKIPGEFYVGGFLGASFVGRNNWDVSLPGANVTFSDLSIRNGVVGGLKLGYFCDMFPYAGLEAETNFTRNDIRQQNVSLSPPIIGPTGSVPAQSFYVWTSSLKLMFRYGFFKDREVPFGRLQPYVGVGPGFVVIYGNADSAKNFSLETAAGLRYMMLKNVSAFVEYQFSKQWNVELDTQELRAPSPFPPFLIARGTATFDFDSHKVVAGVAYHW